MRLTGLNASALNLNGLLLLADAAHSLNDSKRENRDTLLTNPFIILAESSKRSASKSSPCKCESNGLHFDRFEEAESGVVIAVDVLGGVRVGSGAGDFGRLEGIGGRGWRVEGAVGGEEEWRIGDEN